MTPQTRLRSHRPGDVGWILHRQAVVYTEEFGYLPVFERYVAESLPPFLQDHDEARDRLWMAEADDGRILGFIAVHHVDERPGWAKLRWYLVEREARGQGLGRNLMDTALDFCREAGYEGVFLWTVDDLQAARRVYEATGFRLETQDDAPCPWAPWGHEQRWGLPLRPAPRP